jgi:hypothetical protein
MRIYLKSNSLDFKFMWFHNYSLNDMMIGISGLLEKHAKLDIFPELNVSEDELKSLRWNYHEVIEVKEKVDHITCHSDGTFHIKTINDIVVYRDTLKLQQHLGPNTGIFLDFIVMSDLASNYQVAASEPKDNSFALACQPNEFYIIEGKFSGANYPLENDMARRALSLHGIASCVRVNGPALRGILWLTTHFLSQGMLSKRPRIAIMMLKFPATEHRYLIKSFVFS